MSNHLVMRLMSLSISTAKRAGKVIRDIMHDGHLGIVDKGKNDLQTEADRSAQRIIIASLTKQFPNISIIGEEGRSDLDISPDLVVTDFDKEFLMKKCPENFINLKDEDFVVWVDPLDGTSEYTQGLLDHVTVLIGIAFQNSAIGGVIHQPYYKNESGDLGRTIWGLKGLGVGGFNSNKYAPEDKLILTTTRSHSNKVVQSALDALCPTEVLRVGGAGYKVLQLLEGTAHAYVFASAGCKKWDTCAPEAVLEAFGGKLTDMLGQHYEYNANVEYVNKNGVLATSKKEFHKQLVDKIPEDVKYALSK